MFCIYFHVDPLLNNGTAINKPGRGPTADLTKSTEGYIEGETNTLIKQDYKHVMYIIMRYLYTVFEVNEEHY